MADAPQLVVIIGSTLLARRGLGYDLARTVAARPVLLSLDELRHEVGAAALRYRLEREVDVNLRNGRSVIVDRLDPAADRQMLIALAARHDVLDIVVLVPVHHPTADPLIDLATTLPAEGWRALVLLPPAEAQSEIPLANGEQPC